MRSEERSEERRGEERREWWSRDSVQEGKARVDPVRFSAAGEGWVRRRREDGVNARGDGG